MITEIYMLDGDGFDVMTTLRREVPAPKIIVISGRSGIGEMLRAAKLLGADLILPKPVTMDELLTAVETVFGTSPACSGRLRGTRTLRRSKVSTARWFTG
ncbi:MAG: response regulator [Nitrospira sp.]|nr:response regulator [Nitrospira sp.]